MRIPLGHRTRWLTRLGNRTTLVDRRQRHRTNLDILPMVREKFLPVRQGAQLLVGETAEVVCEVCLETARDECARGVASGPADGKGCEWGASWEEGRLT